MQDKSSANLDSTPIRQELSTRINALQIKLRAALFSGWRDELGSRFDEAISSRAGTLCLISDPDAKVRSIGFGLLHRHWSPNPALEETYKQTITFDPEVNVRCAALFCLVGLYELTHACAIPIFLAKTAKDNSAPTELRLLTYQAVFEMMGAPRPIDLISKQIGSDGRLPDTLDWHALDSLLNVDQ
jgi:hypothetical protein